jgi:hypothetical protein
MTIEQGVGQAVVKIRPSRYTLIQPVVLLTLLIPAVFLINPTFVDDPLGQVLTLGLRCMWVLLVGTTVWGLTWGVDLTPESANVRGIRRRNIPWREVQAVLRNEQAGSTSVRLILENGKPATLRAPARLWGLGGAAYDRDFHQIGQWWLAHRGESWRPLRPEAPRPPLQG